MLLWIQLSRMIRGPQILTWPCHIRPLVGLREFQPSATSDYTSVGWRGAADLKERRYGGIRVSKTGSSLLTETALSPSDCGSHQLRDASSQIPTSKVQASASNPECSAVEDLAQNPKAVNTYWDCLSNKVWRRLRDMCQLSHSFANKTQCTYVQSHLYNRQCFVRSLSLWKHNHSRLLPHTHTAHQTRAVHQAAPQVADTWRDCLSVENENRCRQSLGLNLKLYEVERARKGSQSKSQGRWAAVLVCLCCTGGEPAFLFTLRSSTLKGRHKGDVSFAGGKSDPSDRDVVATALREAREELGITVATESVWGVLKPLRDMSGLMVAPVLANVGPLEELSFKPNPGEVEEIFTLSLSHLCNPHNRGYTHFRTGDKYGYTLPVFCNGKHRVWGLTAVALDHTLKLIVPS